jgi:hypothetical protein
MKNVLMIYYFKDLGNKTQIQNFDFFINYGLSLTSFNIKLKIIVNKLESFNNIYKELPDNIDILEYPLYDNASIIKQIISKKYVNNFFEYVCYIESSLIGPIVNIYEKNNWLDKLINQLNNFRAKKHFSGSFILFHKTYFTNNLDIKKTCIKEIPNLENFIFRKNLLPYDYDDEIYNKYINLHFQTEYNNKEKLIFHYLKLFDVISFDKIKQQISEYELEKIKENMIEKEINTEEKIELYTEIISNETFRLACLEQLPIIQHIEIPNIIQNNLCETVLVEFRWFEHLEFLVRNMILKLPLWSHTIVCGNINYDYIRIMCDSIHKDIKIIKLNIDNITPSDYSNLLMSRNFWDNFYGEKILIYQEDSFLFHSKNIDVFLEYDYVGAPWAITQDDNSYGVGNGGFSLRSKSKMIEVIEKVKPEELIIGKYTKTYMQNTNSYILPEDVYFSKSLIDFNIGKVATREIASKFSQECLKSDNPIGGHNFFLAKNNLSICYKQLKIMCDYYEHVTHRGGWRSIIQYGIDKNIIDKNIIDKNIQTISFIDCCEKYFLWESLTISDSWIGIIHLTHNVPQYLHELNINTLFNNENFKKSLNFCKGIFCLSNYQKEWLEQNIKYSLPKINVIYHPISELSYYFNMELFKINNTFQLILLGQQLRKVTDILKVESPLISNKIWLSGINNNIKEHNYLQREISGLQLDSHLFDKFINNVEMKYLNDYSDYDNLIQKSILILSLFDAAANNSVLECIISNTPIFVTRCIGTEEYLGKDYPMFFNDITEINPTLQSSEILFETYEKTHKYLYNMDKSHLTYKRFYSDILKFINI